MSPNAVGGRGFAWSQPMRTAVHITWHGAQINFGDLTPYLTYGFNEQSNCYVEKTRTWYSHEKLLDLWLGLWLHCPFTITVNFAHSDTGEWWLCGDKDVGVSLSLMAQPLEKFLLYVRSLIVQCPRVSDMDSASRENSLHTAQQEVNHPGRERGKIGNWRGVVGRNGPLSPPPTHQMTILSGEGGGGVLVPTHGEIVDRVLTVVCWWWGCVWSASG